VIKKENMQVNVT